ncbi:hypothetical protein HU200_055977 [Digitaria exilis]|uniref:Uncharacterized protein n=1 Tax=Digitaria exilis TaxID=1010633 RepID=A0A835E103_9POAL|nr:hypothetical protein HU200_055977 [Digitaria exilis]
MMLWRLKGKLALLHLKLRWTQEYQILSLRQTPLTWCRPCNQMLLIKPQEESSLEKYVICWNCILWSVVLAM